MAGSSDRRARRAFRTVPGEAPDLPHAILAHAVPHCCTALLYRTEGRWQAAVGANRLDTRNVAQGKHEESRMDRVVAAVRGSDGDLGQGRQPLPATESRAGNRITNRAGHD